ncbi:DTW domain-containing protein [Pendulispora rubella]|uniref:tRNA-uridine aminocarboxypropyltransferase n=1 Tax=Pendulispora rubella TaxID=2741070 RepID=A0ABZ2L1A5_9BACT
MQESIVPREVCDRCRRPASVCYCAHITPIETKTRLVLLQHPRERDVAIGTARMASLCLRNSDLHVGAHWGDSPALARALSDPERPPILLYPGEGAIDIMREPPPGPVTLVVVDGTWAQTKKLVKTNPVLSALPRYAFTPPRPSEYRIRKEPHESCVATIEALVHVLSALEGDPARFSKMLLPFRAMIDSQLAAEARFQGAGSRHQKRRARIRRMGVPRVMTERQADLLCVVAEANAWSYRERAANPELRDELVMWAAHRPSTGETFSFIVAPQRELAPSTTMHTGIDEATLRAGGSLEELHAAWRTFVRDTDVICSWGRYEPNLFEASGGHLPEARLDLRHVAKSTPKSGVRTLGEPPPSPAFTAGRADRKLRGLCHVASSLVALAS